jgi:trigger factor
MYGKSVLAEALNKIIPEALQNYIREQQLNVVGTPISIKNNDEIELEIGNDFDYNFEIGLAPVVEINLSKDDSLTKYKIIVDDDLIDHEVEMYSKRYGQFVNVDTVTDFTERLTGDIVEMNGDEPLEDGLSAQDTSILLSLITGDELKKPFENVKIDGEIIFNLSATFPNEREIASILKKTDKAEVGDIGEKLFRYTVKSIQRYTSAELDSKLFDKVLGEGAVKSLEEFKEMIKDSFQYQYADICQSKFIIDVREYLQEKFNLPLPEKFLRKWLRISDREISDEALENGFPSYLKDRKWELIVNFIVKQNSIKVEDPEIISFTRKIVNKQLTMYGANGLPLDVIDGYAQNYLKEEKNVHSVASQVLEIKVAETVGELVNLTVQEVTVVEYNNIVRGENKEQDENGNS